MLTRAHMLFILLTIAVIISFPVLAQEQNGDIRYPIPAPGFTEAECIEADPVPTQLQRCDDTAQHYCGNLNVVVNQLGPTGMSCSSGWVLCSWNCGYPTTSDLSTPTFFINNFEVLGAGALPEIKQLIEAFTR